MPQKCQMIIGIYKFEKVPQKKKAYMRKQLLVHMINLFLNEPQLYCA